MTQIPLLEPVVLNEVVRQLQVPEQLLLSSSLPKVRTPVSYYTWDIIRGTREMARFNVPNSEANIVDQHGVTQNQASLAYTREKKVFEPTTTMWIKQVGTIDGIQNAEEHIMGEIQDLNRRVDNLVEYSCWQVLKGGLHYNKDGVIVDVDSHIPSENNVSPSVDWSDPSTNPSDIVSDVETWVRQVQRTERVNITDAWCTQPTINYIMQSFIRNAEGGGLLLTDGQRAAYYNSGSRTLPGFLGINWHVVEGQYDDDNGDVQQFLGDNELVLTNLREGQAMKLVEGPGADFAAGQGRVGKFMKTWEEPDPSARQALLEYRFLPIITRPGQVLVVADVTTP